MRTNHVALVPNTSSMLTSSEVSLGACYDVVVADLLRRSDLSDLARVVANANPRGKRDPIPRLNDELLVEILTFLVGEPETREVEGVVMTKSSWLCYTGPHVYARLRLVNHAWKKTFERILPDFLGLVDTHISSIHTRKAPPLLRLLCIYKIQIGSFHVSQTISRKTSRTQNAQLLQDVLKECNTTQTRSLDVHYSQPLLGVAAHRIFNTRNDTAKDKALHDLIAQECPNLVKASLSLALPMTTPIYSNYISHDLFSSSISRLSLTVSFPETGTADYPWLKWGTSTPIDCRLFTTVIQNMPRLQHLSIGYHTEIKGGPLRFHIKSPTLQSLCCHMTRGPIVSVDCPNLRSFKCSVGREYNTCLLNTESCRQIFRQSLQDDVPSPLQVSASEVGHSPFLLVPDTCTVHFCRLYEWKGVPNALEELMDRVEANANSSYQTFDRWDHSRAAAADWALNLFRA